MTSPPRPARPIVCVGDLMVDVVTRLSGPLVPGSDRAASIRVRSGGSAANTACWLASLGAPVTLIARVGGDAFGRLATRELGPGVRPALAVDPDRPTGTCVVLVGADGERTMCPDAGANAALSPDDLDPDEFRAGRHLHLSAYPLFGAARPAAARALDLARACGMSISVDAASAAPLAAVGAETFLDWIGPDVLLFANLDEARVLTGCSDPADCARRLGARVGRAVVKLGVDGAVWSDGASVVREATSAVTIVDSTGAGDAFAAGLLVALDGPGRCADPARALRSAHLIAGRACRVVGGRPD